MPCGIEGVEAGKQKEFRAQELCQSPGGRPGLPVPNNQYGLCERKATLNWNFKLEQKDLVTQELC